MWGGEMDGEGGVSAWGGGRVGVVQEPPASGGAWAGRRRGGWAAGPPISASSDLRKGDCADKHKGERTERGRNGGGGGQGGACRRSGKWWVGGVVMAGRERAGLGLAAPLAAAKESTVSSARRLPKSNEMSGESGDSSGQACAGRGCAWAEGGARRGSCGRRGLCSPPRCVGSARGASRRRKPSKRGGSAADPPRGWTPDPCQS